MKRSRPVLPLGFGFFVLYLAFRHPSFSIVPNVLVFTLIAAGFCFGLGIGALLMNFQNRAT